MKLAGYPSGKYTGTETVQIVGSTGNPAIGDAQIVNEALQKLGFKTKLNARRPVGHVLEVLRGREPKRSTSARTSAGSATSPTRRRRSTCRSTATAIVQNGQLQLGSQLNDPKINAAMEAATKVVGIDARAKAWAKIDEELVAEAVAVP